MPLANATITVVNNDFDLASRWSYPQWHTVIATVILVVMLAPAVSCSHFTRTSVSTRTITRISCAHSASNTAEY